MIKKTIKLLMLLGVLSLPVTVSASETITTTSNDLEQVLENLENTEMNETITDESLTNENLTEEPGNNIEAPDIQDTEAAEVDVETDSDSKSEPKTEPEKEEKKTFSILGISLKSLFIQIITACFLFILPGSIIYYRAKNGK